jgi:hypothetical protein
MEPAGILKVKYPLRSCFDHSTGSEEKSSKLGPFILAPSNKRNFFLRSSFCYGLWSFRELLVCAHCAWREGRDARAHTHTREMGKERRCYWVKREEETGSQGIVAAIGWMFSKQRHLLAYSRLYAASGWDSLVCHPHVLNLSVSKASPYRRCNSVLVRSSIATWSLLII